VRSQFQGWWGKQGVQDSTLPHQPTTPVSSRPNALPAPRVDTGGEPQEFVIEESIPALPSSGALRPEPVQDADALDQWIDQWSQSDSVPAAPDWVELPPAVTGQPVHTP